MSTYITSSVARNIVDIENISERLLKIRVRKGNRIASYIQVYAPCNDTYTDEDKDMFFGELSDAISRVHDSEDLYIMGDFNGRVGKRRSPWLPYLGPHNDHETHCNYNGNHVLDLFAAHKLVVTNTLFEHRPSHIYS